MGAIKKYFSDFFGFIKELIFHPKKSLEQTYPMGWLTILIHYILLMLIGYSALVLYGAFDFNSFIDSWGKGLIYFPILFVLSSMLIWMLLHRPSLKGMAQAWIKGIFWSIVFSILLRLLFVMSFWMIWFSEVLFAVIIGGSTYVFLKSQSMDIKKSKSSAWIIVILLFIMPSLSLFVLKSMGMLSMRRFGPDGFFRSKIHLIDDLDQKSKYMPTDDRYSRDFQKIVNKLAGDDIKKQKAIRQYISSIRMVLERNDWVEINEVQKNAQACMWARFSNEEGLEISVGAKKMIFDSYEKIKRYHQFNASLNGKMSGMPPFDKALREKLCEK